LSYLCKGNTRRELTECERSSIEWAIKNAASLLNKPGFALDTEQIAAIWACFENHVSVLTGPPGSGKTAVCGIVNAIAAMLFDIDPPAQGVALAGRAAANLHEATVCHHEGRAIPMPSSTIHRVLQMKTSDDGGEFKSNARIATGVLIIDESSMNSSPLMAAIVRNADAKHMLFVGDRDQLPPIGPGKPFQDIIASNLISVTRLTRNYRTGCEGIQMLCGLVRGSDEQELNCFLYECVEAGGVELVECEGAMKAPAAGEYFASLLSHYKNVHYIAILTPHNKSESGVLALNIAVREALGLPKNKVAEGEIVLITENNCEAATPDDDENVEGIFNGERAIVSDVGKDFIDLNFHAMRKGLSVACGYS
jgi:ATP-dependent exoDNAse (exonuclease V) alpha subunit